MFFVIKYDREKGIRTLFEEFPNDAYERAQQRRLQIEIESISECDRVEVVMFEAESLEMFQTTHRRYFKNVEELAEHMNDPRTLPKGEKPNPLKQ